MPKRNVFLIGMMASGKSTVGRHLARALSLDFVDSDSVIEDRAGADIPWIFDIEGEEKFRDREERVIDELTQRNGVVIATGGGVVLREINRRRLSERGTVVYLNAPFESLVARAQGNTRRPLLAGENARDKLVELMDQRGDLYAQTADIEIHTDDRPPRGIAQRIVAELEA
ncbi:MAG: shikimate kinase AroK [Gammaproteobacteria bacterium]|nr:shikimate kinase AroK [Gammaproteobacteria bacterium]MDE0226893.1 shikimate kinase AroK [Gammaproteobacteria bacterium]